MDNLSTLSDEEIGKELRIRKFSAQSSALTTRYRDAYTVANVTVGFGTIIKVVGVIIGVILAYFGFTIAGPGRANDPSALFGIILIALGVVVGALFYVIGILVSAQGQILKATLDSAVNTSPFLEDEHRTKIMSLGFTEGSRSPQANPTNQINTCEVCGKPLSYFDRVKSIDKRCSQHLKRDEV